MTQRLLLFAVLLCASCTVNNPGNKCAVDTDCSEVELCMDGVCESACGDPCGDGEVCDPQRRACIGTDCTTGADCGPNQTCAGGRCLDSTGCTTALDCPDGQSCLDGQCFDGECSADRHCPNPLTCVDHVCIPPEGCIVGQVRCNANTVVTCLAGGQEVEELCAMGSICLETDGTGACHPVICEAGQRQCADTDTVSACNMTGTAMETVDCGPGQICADGACGAVPCEPFEIGCADDNTAYACDADGALELLPCRPDQFCEDALCRDRACVPGESRCVGDTVVTCNDDGTGVRRVYCGDQLQCDVPGGCACVNLECVPRVCVPGARRCVGNGAQACAPDGTTWLARTACGEEEACVSGSCVPTQCEQGARLCSGEVLLTCDGGWTPDDCGERGQLCEEGRCRDRACEPGAAICADGDVATRCNVRGDGVEPGTDCGDLGQSCRDGQCVDACEPGARRCEGAGVRVCLEDGITERDIPCAETQICLDGFCRAPVCVPGEPGCNGARVAECNQDGTGYLPGGEDCADRGLRCRQGTCVEGENECPVTSARAGSPEASVPLRAGVVVVPAAAALVLDGTQSTDDDTVVRVIWRRVDGPGGITLAADLDARRALVTGLRPMERYVFEAVAVDSTGVEACEAAYVEVHTVGSEQLVFHLLWDNDGDPDQEDNSGADVDLHLPKTRSGVWFEQPFDCHWNNQHPDWAPESPDQVLDDTNGRGPEIVVLDDPSPCEWYAVGVHYWRAAFGPARAHINVFNGGLLVWSRWDHALPATGAWWEAMLLHWPTGRVFATDRDFAQPRQAQRPLFSESALSSQLCGIPDDVDD